MADDQNQNRKIDELITLTKENNHLLHKLVNGARLARAARVVYYIIIIGSAIGAYYYIQPILSATLEAYKPLLPKSFQNIHF